MLPPGSYSLHAPYTNFRSAMLQTEHIDNPKGYGEGEDARNYDRRLRGVSAVHFICLILSGSHFHSLSTYVTPWNMHSASSERIYQPQELEVDPRTGMKNYIANGQASNLSISLLPH